MRLTHTRSYLSAFRIFAFRHPVYAYKLFRAQKLGFEERCYFHVKETLRLVQKRLQNPKFSDVESIIEDNTLTYRFFTFLYAVCRWLKPSVVVETGVGAGLSSSFILQALHDNNFGRLYSIDLPRAVYQSDSKKIINDSFWIPHGKDSGWVIPYNLREKWALMRGKSIDKLPKLLADLGYVDLFIHDSEHTYNNMMWEYQTVWPYMSSKGVLVSHDVDFNDAFVDFGKQINLTPIVFPMNNKHGERTSYGLIIKAH